ncbi:MAG: protein disulfide isomerase family protein [Sulfobacillus sp.]
MTSFYRGSSVIELTDKDFDFGDSSSGPRVVNPNLRGKHGFIKFYATRCHFCKEKKEAWKAMSKALSPYGICFAAVQNDAPGTEKIFEALNVQGFPTFYLFDKNGLMIDYRGGFKINDMLCQLCDVEGCWEQSKPLCQEFPQFCDSSRCEKFAPDYDSDSDSDFDHEADSDEA